MAIITEIQPSARTFQITLSERELQMLQRDVQQNDHSDDAGLHSDISDFMDGAGVEKIDD